jgi:hypothetical protein
MLLRVVSVFVLAAFAFPAIVDAAAAKKKKEDEVVGSIWTWTITNGDKKETGSFRVHDLNIYKDDKIVGSAAEDAAKKATLTFTGIPELNGTAEVQRHKVGHCTGTLKKKDGTEWKFEAHITEN